jgi:hypothetical protein
LPNWRDDAEFSDMIQTLIAAMPLAKKSNLKVKSLKQILALTGGVTSRIFSLVTHAKALKSVRADATFALQSPRPDVRLFCLAAIAVAQSRVVSRSWWKFEGGVISG